MGKFKRKNAYKDKKDPNKKVKNGEGEYNTSEFVKENIHFETFYKVKSPTIFFIVSSNFKTNSRLSQNLSNS